MVGCVYFVDERVFVSLVNFKIQITYKFLLWLRILCPIPEDEHPILYILIFVLPIFLQFLSVYQLLWPVTTVLLHERRTFIKLNRVLREMAEIAGTQERTLGTLVCVAKVWTAPS